MNFDTLEEAKDYLRSNWEEGVECPCCHRLVKLYGHKLNSGSARSLIILYHQDKLSPGEWVHIQKHFASLGLNANGMNYILLKHWKLIERKKENDDPDKRASGFWRITQKGIDYVEKRTTAPSHVYIYSNKVMRESKEQITIVEALGKKFSYQELMEA